jgi:hypothetical protein
MSSKANNSETVRETGGRTRRRRFVAPRPDASVKKCANSN